MRSGRAVVGAASELMNQAIPSPRKRDLKTDKWNNRSTIVASEFQVLDPGQPYADYLEGIQHSSTCEKSLHFRKSLKDSSSSAASEGTTNICFRPSTAGYREDNSRGCFRCGEKRKVVGKTEESKIYNYEDDETEFLSLKEFDREQAFYDYYYVQNPQNIGRELGRRSSDCGIQRYDHSRRFPFVLRGRLKKASKCQKSHNRSQDESSECPRLTRSLEELPGDIKDHILKCKCSCDHLGYGNYSTLSLKELPGNNWRLSQEPFKSLSLNDDKQEPMMKFKQRELEIKYHVWGVVCLVLVLAGVAGVGVSVPLALKATPSPTIEEENTTEERLTEAKVLLSDTLLVDGHNDLPWNIRKFMHNRLHSFNMTADLSNLRPWSRSSWSHTDLPRLREGHVGAQFWVAYIPCESQYLNAVQLTIEQIDLIKRMVDQYPNDLRLAASANDVEHSFKEGQIASLIGVEGGHAIQNSLGVLRALFDLGVRYMTLTHTCSTPWAECARNKESDPEDPDSPRGLTHFGKTVVREMNRLGILVDLSHASQATMRAALQITRSPVLFSHSSVYAICRNPRNVPDDILKKVASNGGLVMVSFYNQYLTCSNEATVKDVIKHINHVRKIAGIDHVGIGADFDGVNQLPSGLEDVSKYPNLFAELLNDPTWAEEDLKKLAGLNLLRVLRDVETVSQKIKEQNIGPYEEDVPFREQKIKNNCAYRFLKDDRL